MRKIPSNLDNPIDNIIINFCEGTVETLKKMNFTPNMLTTISLLLAIFSVILFCYDYYKFSAIIFFISYIFDCLDGHYARKYNMVTKFGCYYDHISDTFKYVLFSIAVYYKSKNKFILLLPIFIGLFILSLIHTGCMEIYTDINVQSESLTYFKSFCPSDKANDYLKYTKYFGFGTFNVLFVLIIFTFDWF